MFFDQLALAIDANGKRDSSWSFMVTINPKNEVRPKLDTDTGVLGLL